MMVLFAYTWHVRLKKSDDDDDDGGYRSFGI